MWLKTGDVVRAFRLVWPYINGHLVRAEAEQGAIKAEQFRDGGNYFFDPAGIQPYLVSKNVPDEKILEVLRALGINFKQLVLLKVS